MQLHDGISDDDDRRQKAACSDRYRRRDDDSDKSKRPVDAEIDEECGICMELNGKVVLPNCSHAMCIECYRQW
jgi:hypothetical protein